MSYRPKIKKTVSGVVTKVDLPLDAETIKGLDIIENNKIKSSLLPAIAITDTYVVNSEQAMLALQAETGDVAIRTDSRKTYILTTNDPSIATNWKELLSPGTVVSVNGQTGTVELTYSDVGACANNDSRLSDARPASDVPDWAKEANKPSYTYSEISGAPTDLGDFTNNAGYTKNVGTVTSVNNIPPDSNGNVTIVIPADSVTSVNSKTGDVVLTYSDVGAQAPIDDLGTIRSNAAAGASKVSANNSTITIKKNGVKVDDFTLNQSIDKDINITVPAEVTETTVTGWGFIKIDAVEDLLDTDYSMGYDSFGLWQNGIDDAIGHTYTMAQADERFQLKLESGINIKTINSTSLLGSGNIDITVVTESTVAGWGFIYEDDIGTYLDTECSMGASDFATWQRDIDDTAGHAYTKPASGIPASDLAETYLKTTDVSDWAKAATKPSYTASEVGAYPDTNPNGYTSVIESTVIGWGFTKTKGTVTSVNSTYPDSNGNVNVEATTTVITLVDTLPTTDISTNMLYSVPKSSGAVSGDTRDEYYSVPGSTTTTETVSGVTADTHAIDQDHEYIGSLTVGNVTDIQISLDGIAVARRPHSYSYTYSDGVIHYVMGSLRASQLVSMKILYKPNVWEKIGGNTNAGTVTSVRVQAGTGLTSSTSTAQTSTLDTTISIASGYKLPTTVEWNSKANSSDIGNGRITIKRNSDDTGTYFNLNSSTDKTINLNIPETGQYYPYRLTLRKNNGEGTGDIAMQLLLANSIGNYTRGDNIPQVEALGLLDNLGPYIRDVVERAWHYDANNNQYILDYENLAFVVYDTGEDPSTIYLWFFDQGTIVNNINYDVSNIVDYDDGDNTYYHFVLE